MFFVLSINTRTNSGKIVQHAATLEEAITTVSECAREYVLNKSEPLLHRRPDGGTAGAAGSASAAETRFFSSNSQSTVHQIDVFKQKIDIVKGWLGTTQVSHTPTLVRRFMYCFYASASALTDVPQPPPPPPPTTTQMDAPKSLATIKRTPKVIPTGGFPSNVLDALIENTQFQRHRQTTDSNVLSSMFIETTDEESD